MRRSAKRWKKRRGPFSREALVGIYFWEQPEKHRSFLRVTFCGQALNHDPARRLDRGIERAVVADPR